MPDQETKRGRQMGASMISEEVLSKRTAFLKMTTPFSELKSENLEILAKKFRVRDYKKTDTIFHQGDDSDALYIVKKGKVRIFGLSPAGNETSYRIFSKYDVIGEFAAIDGRPRSTTAQAIESSTLLEINCEQFQQFIHEMPDLAMSMIKLLVEKLRFTTTFTESMVQYDTTGRLLNMIIQYNEMHGVELEAGKKYELDLFMRQEEIATMVGARREWVNRILSKWNKQGLIEYKRGKIKILDLPAFEKERDRRIGFLKDGDEW